MSLTRRALLQGLLGLGLPWAAGAGGPERVEIASVENWVRREVGTRGIPAGWRAYETIGGRPTYDFTVVAATRDPNSLGAGVNGWYVRTIPLGG